MTCHYHESQIHTLFSNGSFLTMCLTHLNVHGVPLHLWHRASNTHANTDCKRFCTKGSWPDMPSIVIGFQSLGCHPKWCIPFKTGTPNTPKFIHQKSISQEFPLIYCRTWQSSYLWRQSPHVDIIYVNVWYTYWVLGPFWNNPDVTYYHKIPQSSWFPHPWCVNHSLHKWACTKLI